MGLRRARLLDILGEAVYYSGDWLGSEAPYREEYDLLRGLATAEPMNLAISRRLVRAGWGLGATLVDTHRAEEGERVLAEARVLAERLKELDPEDSDLARLVEITTQAHAYGLTKLRRFDEARPLLERDVTEQQRRWANSPQEWSLLRNLAIAQQTLADMWADAGDAPKACTTYEAALASFRQIDAAGKSTQLDKDFSLPNIYKRVRPLCPALAREGLGGEARE
jgi:hypothetical protein